MRGFCTRRTNTLASFSAGPSGPRYRLKFHLADGSHRYAMRWGRIDLRTAEQIAEYQPVIDGINTGQIRMGYSADGEIFTTEELWTEMLGQPIEDFIAVVRVEVEQVDGGLTLRVRQ